MPEATFSDEWLVQSLEGLVDAERLAELRGKADPAKTLWETLVAAKTCTDEQILGKLAARFRMKVADATQIDPKVREVVPETLARRYRILPLRMTDSYLEVATAQSLALNLERTVVQLRGQKLIAQVALIRALGGGWQPPTQASAH